MLWHFLAMVLAPGALSFDCARYTVQCVDTSLTPQYADCAATVAANPSGMTCRIEHLGRITDGDSATQTQHCPHAQETATGPCASENPLASSPTPSPSPSPSPVPAGSPTPAPSPSPSPVPASSPTPSPSQSPSPAANGNVDGSLHVSAPSSWMWAVCSTLLVYSTLNSARVQT
eukprot:TRINITY_DN10182_c0_g3_i2.p1 TRINITY_DN10182_c0_g3~~TRINITY_DN10182_c0_g3_i2.p1  ORF type:complete len:174 (+),score=14.97 TRINITY_DN10182_c0_g3_i2:79-600(+)